MRFSVFAQGWNAIAEFLFPTCCPVCSGKLLHDEEVVCAPCLATVSRTEHATLADNGIDMLFAELIKDYGKRIHYERGAAFGFYNRARGKNLRLLIERGKFGPRPQPEIFERLGKEAAREFVGSALLEDIDLLVPVPLHPTRLHERGFNQAEYICRGLQAITHIPMDTDHLVRLRNNPHQSRSRYDNRMRNVEGLFGIVHPEEWKGKHILLVDDVITSGATMLACMKPLTPVRGSKISVFALGWARS